MHSGYSSVPGPDDTGTWIDPHGRADRGYNRFVIIDLTCGRQPMSNEAGSIQLFISRQFYEFEKICADMESAVRAFRTKSDTEITIHLRANLRCVCGMLRNHSLSA